MRVSVAVVMVLLSCAVVCGAEESKDGSSNASSAQGDSLRILGFEKDELGKLAKEVKELTPDECHVLLCKIMVSESHLQFRIRKGDASEGAWAFEFPISKDLWERDQISGQFLVLGFKPGLYQSNAVFNPRPQKLQADGIKHLVSHDIFTTYHVSEGINSEWFSKLPAGRNWSAYSKFQVDFKTGADAVLRIAVEDEEISPPAERRFKIPAGRWVTAELDLDAAVKARGLNKAKMANFWVYLEETSEPTTLLMDNMRLVKGDAKPVLPCLRDDSTWEVPKRVYAINPGGPMPAAWKSPGYWKVVPYPEKDEPSPPREASALLTAVTKPVIAHQSKGPKVFLSTGAGDHTLVVYDSKRMLVPFLGGDLGFVKWDGTGCQNPKVVVTTDGGQTWTGADGESGPTIMSLHTEMIGSPGGVSPQGDEYYMLNSLGCSAYGFPSDRLFCRKVRLTAQGWKAYPATCVDSDIRHCTERAVAVKLASGRVWAAWPHFSRLGKRGIGAKFSDDGCRTWQTWNQGKAPVLPRSEALGAGGATVVHLVTWGDHVACSGHVDFWIYDGKDWIEQPGFKALNGGRVESIVSSTGPVAMFATASGVYRWDGKSGGKETIDGYKNTKRSRLAVCGGNVLLFSVQPETPNRLQYWRRNAEGKWTGPGDVVSEEKPIATFSVPQFPAGNAVPVSWTGDQAGWVKMALVPGNTTE